MLKIMYDQYKTITLSGLAEQLHYTVPYCSKYLKNVFGCTFSAMIQKIRFQNAECLLRNSDMTVSEVGKEIGYENTENFFRAFKKALSYDSLSVSGCNTGRDQYANCMWR